MKRNDTTLQDIGKERMFIASIVKKKVEFMGCLLRDDGFITNILEGKVTEDGLKEDPNNPISTTFKNWWASFFTQHLNNTSQKYLAETTRSSL